ncbi:hypothetical protein GBF38_010030, partial [Nibea albiflora]
RREVPWKSRGRSEARRAKKDNLKAFHGFGALVFCISVTQDKATATVKEKRFAQKLAKEAERHEEEDI